jgi:hypothetical protein
MKPYPAPTSEGWHWAKLIHPSKMPEGEDWASGDWEVVNVCYNGGEGDEKYVVCVSGIEPSQWIPDFVWGPEVIRPKELDK